MNYKDLDGWPGYGIDDEGGVWSYRRGGGGLLTTKRKLIPWVKPSGHHCVSLRRDGKTFKKMVHQLVLETFVGPCPEGMEGCHGKEGVSVNAVRNLRWDTHQENHKDRFRHGERYGTQKLSPEQVAEVKRLRASGIKLKPIALQFGITEANVCAIAKGKTWSVLS